MVTTACVPVLWIDTIRHLWYDVYSQNYASASARTKSPLSATAQGVFLLVTTMLYCSRFPLCLLVPPAASLMPDICHLMPVCCQKYATKHSVCQYGARNMPGFPPWCQLCAMSDSSHLLQCAALVPKYFPVTDKFPLLNPYFLNMCHTGTGKGFQGLSPDKLRFVLQYAYLARNIRKSGANSVPRQAGHNRFCIIKKHHRRPLTPKVLLL